MGNRSQLHPDNRLMRQISQLDVYCRRKDENGCSWRGPLKDVQGHMDKDECTPAVCCPDGCNRQILALTAKVRELEANHAEKVKQLETKNTALVYEFVDLKRDFQRLEQLVLESKENVPDVKKQFNEYMIAV